MNRYDLCTLCSFRPGLGTFSEIKAAVPQENTGGRVADRQRSLNDGGYLTENYICRWYLSLIIKKSQEISVCLSWPSAAPCWMHCLPSMPNVKNTVTVMLFEMDNSIVFDFRCTWWCSVTWRRGGADYLQGLQRHLDVLEFPQQVEGSVLQTQQHSIVTVGHTLQMNLSRCLICLIVRLLKRNDKASLRPWPTCVQTDRFVFGGRRLSSCWSRFVAMWRFTASSKHPTHSQTAATPTPRVDRPGFTKGYWESDGGTTLNLKWRTERNRRRKFHIQAN